MKTRSLTCIALVLVLALGLCACTAGESAQKEKVVMNVALAGDIVRLDPAFAYDNDTSVVIDSITEGLITHNADNSIKCMLAESWEAVDPVTYVYKIRNNVNFSDGTPMTVDDVVYSLQRHMNPDLGSYMNWFFDNVESIEATGDWEVTIKLASPDATFQYVLATSAGMIVKKSYAEEKGAEFGSAAGGVIGTGPFKFESWVSGSKIVLTKNENYWDKTAKTNVDEIDFTILADDTTLATALKSGQIDFAANFSDNLVDTLSAYENLNVYREPAMNIHYLAFNTAREPFNDVNVRQAIGYAIDLDAINDSIIKGLGAKGTQLPMPESLFTVEKDRWIAYRDSLPGYVFDLDQARACLAKSSVPNGFSCQLMVAQSSSQRYDVALVVQQQLKQIGIDVEIVTVTGDEFYSYQFGNVLDANGIRDYDMLVATWGADYPDPAGNLNPLFTISNIGAGGYNCASYTNEELDKLLTDANKVTDNSERVDMLLKACEIIVADQPYYFYNYPLKFRVVSKNYDFGDMNITSSWDWNFKDMVFTPGA